MNDVSMVEVEIAEQWKIILPKHRADRGEEWKKWEREHLESMHEALKPGDVVYDVGSEEGDFPGLFASWGCELVMFEPNPLVIPNTRAIWEANDFPMPLGFFVGFAGHTDTFNKPGEWLDGCGWFIDRWPPCAYGPVIGNHGFANLCERPDIPAITLNTAATHVKPPDHITIDVEGSELAVLQGAAAVVLTEIRPTIWVSIHPAFMEEMYGHTPDMLHSLMGGHGYTGELLIDAHEEHWKFTPKPKRKRAAKK